MFEEKIKGLKYNQINETLTIFYRDGEKKDVHMSKEEYEELLKTGKLNL